MSQVSVTIDGRKYRLACNEGEEPRLESLAGMIDEKIGEMRKTFGEIGDQRLVIMRSWDDTRERLRGVNMLLKRLAEIAAQPAAAAAATPAVVKRR